MNYQEETRIIPHKTTGHRRVCRWMRPDGSVAVTVTQWLRTGTVDVEDHGERSGAAVLRAHVTAIQQAIQKAEMWEFEATAARHDNTPIFQVEAATK